MQKETEKVADYIQRLERVFHITYGRDSMSKETRQSFLYGQLQEGLRHDLMQNAAVAGALTYTELIMATKNEEQRQSELKKRHNYQFGLRNPRRITGAGQVEPTERLTLHLKYRMQLTDGYATLWQAGDSRPDAFTCSGCDTSLRCKA